MQNQNEIMTTRIAKPPTKSRATTNLVPAIGTEVKLSQGDATKSEDGRTWLCRIAYDEVQGQWVVASRFEIQSNSWVSCRQGVSQLGILVFLNDWPATDGDYTIRVSAIQRSGRGAFADILWN